MPVCPRTRRVRSARASRGLPVWQALGLLVLLPLVAAAVMGGASVISAQRAADQALRAQKLVAAVERLDTVRRAAVAEVLPTMGPRPRPT